MTRPFQNRKPFKRAGTLGWACLLLSAWGFGGCGGDVGVFSTEAGSTETRATGADATGAEAAQENPSKAPAALVEVRRAKASERAAALWVTGTLVSLHDARIAAEVAGRLVSVAQIGDRFKKDEVIARVDETALRIELRADESEIRRLEARLDYLEKQRRRFETLTAEHIASRHQLDDLESQLAMAHQDLEGARIERDRTRHLLDRSSLRAPFPGRLVERLAEPGDFVTVGKEVARLVDLDHGEVAVRAPLRVAPWVREGSEVEVEGPAGRSHVGRVRAAVPVGDELSRTFEVRIAVDGSPWAVGSPLRVSLPRGEAPTGGVEVPRDALILRRGKTYLYVIEEEGRARRVDVVPGLGESEDSIPVAGDLEPGDRVVVRGGETLRPGQNVEIVAGKNGISP